MTRFPGISLCVLALLSAGSAPAQDQPHRRSLSLPPEASAAEAVEVVGRAVGEAFAAPPGYEVSISTRVAFEFDSARLTPVALTQLAHIAAAMNGQGSQGARFLIEGHTDSKGAEAYNLRLSERRAQAVLNQLAAYGVAPGRISGIGFGEARPLPGADPGAAVQRRVEFLILR